MKNNRIGVGGILFNSEGHVLLVRRGADAPRFPEAWTLPTGFVDVGEDIVYALRREMSEELGIDFKPDPKAFFVGDKKGAIIYYYLGAWRPESESVGIELRPSPKGIMENDAFAFFPVPEAIRLGNKHHFVFAKALNKLNFN